MALRVFRHETSGGCPSESPFHSDTAGNKLLPEEGVMREAGFWEIQSLLGKLCLYSLLYTGAYPALRACVQSRPTL